MNPVFPAQKRAEEFSSMVEGTSTTALRDTGKYADLVPLVGLVTSLRQAPAPEARPEFVSDLRSRLMLAAETALVPDTSAQVEARRQATPRRTGRERRLAVAIGGFALVSASASMSVAAQTALPGDTLYPLKRALENVHESVLRDADDKGATMLDNASGRLAEVDKLSRNGGQDPQVIADTLEDFAAQAVEASDVLIGDFQETGRLQSIEELRSFTSSSLEALQRLETLVPVEARGSLIEATRILGDIDALALSACPTCGDTVTAAVTTATDLIGPLYEPLVEATKPEPAATRPGPKKQAPPKKPATASAQPSPLSPPATTHQTQAPATDGADEDKTPTLPSGPDGSNTPESGSGDNPLGPLVTGLNDPIGDLITGTLETADELLTGGQGATDKKSDQ